MNTGFVPAPLAALPWRPLLLVLAIGGAGVAVLFSAAGGDLRPWAFSHLVRFGTFLAIALGLSRLREGFWIATAVPAYLASLALLASVELFGVVRGGARSWINLGFMQLQPSELMKVTVLIALAAFYAKLPIGQIRSWTAIWPALLIIGIPFALILLQPDLGTATMLAAGGVVIMFLAGLPLRVFVGSGLALLAALPIAFSMLHDYQRNRVLTFLDPERDPLGTGYHIIQSKIAIGSGGLFGKGFLQGTQGHLDYLPEEHTDFVFSAMAEEFGLVGGVLMIAAFLALVHWGMQVARRAPTRFGRLAAVGLASTIFFHVAANLMMVMGLAPVVGIPLPLVSFGGSSMLTIMICVGILMSLAREPRSTGRFA